jgi:hypothetical protein
VGQDSQTELQDLTAVYNFYADLLEKSLGHPIPSPAGIRNADASAENSSRVAEHFRNWLDVLDLAVTPPIVRDALKAASGLRTAHSLLRYYIRKASPRSGDRDKTDCVITYLFRNPPQSEGNPPAWQRPDLDSSHYFVSQAALGFQGELYRALEGMEYSPLSAEQAQLLHELEYFFQELGDYRHFDQIMDSGIVQRVRELKQSLGRSFYHPDALAQFAVWNDFFGRKFDELFHDAAKQIKTFADNVQKEGGSILSRLEGDITVKQLAEVEPQQILSEDYQHAQDEFRKVSRFKKVVDSKKSARAAGPVAGSTSVSAPAAPRIPIPTSSAVPPEPPGNNTAPERRRQTAPLPPMKAEVLAVPPSQAVQKAVQETKIDSTRESIKQHIRSVDPKFAFIVPVQKTKITLSQAEVDAFRADYQGEKSFRADYVAVMIKIVAYLSRMIVEVDEYNQKANSAYLWKPHADALAYLLSTLEQLSMEADAVISVARSRGLQDKVIALETSLNKLRDYAKTVSQTLQAAGQNTPH